MKVTNLHPYVDGVDAITNTKGLEMLFVQEKCFTLILCIVQQHLQVPEQTSHVWITHALRPGLRTALAGICLCSENIPRTFNTRDSKGKGQRHESCVHS